jgi:Tfp pilus assembly protein PilF
MPERPPPQPKASVTLALQDEAQRAATAGDFSKATQILERAIRIEPDRAELWIELARVHLKEGNAAQAEQFARKALLFTHDRYDLEQQAWVVIADARAAKR